MCGRYSLDGRSDEIKLVISALDARYPRSAWHLGDIRPGDMAPVLVSDAGHIHARLFAWGFPLARSLVINARAESAQDKPLFADCVAKRRCVIPSAGFYEWSPEKVRHLFTLPDAKALYMAALYDVSAGAPRFCILTTEANASVQGVHPRMPLVLRREQVREWLDQPELAGGLLRAVPPSLCCAESQDGPGTEAGFRV